MTEHEQIEEHAMAVFGKVLALYNSCAEEGTLAFMMGNSTALGEIIGAYAQTVPDADLNDTLTAALATISDAACAPTTTIIRDLN